MEIYIIGGLITFSIVMLIEYIERDYNCDCKEIFWEAFWLGFIWPATIVISFVILFNHFNEKGNKNVKS